MATERGWLFDAYPKGDKMVVWLKRPDDSMVTLEDDWRHSIFVGGETSRLKELARNKDIASLVCHLSFAEQIKKEKILEAANRLKEMGFRKDWIASTLAEYSHDLGVSRGYIYEALPDEFKSKKRSEAQKEAKAAKVLSQGSDLEERQLRELVVENDGNSSGDTTGDDKGKRVTKRWKEAAVIVNSSVLNYVHC